MACLQLKNIYENKKDEIEKAIAGCDISEHESEIPCITEGVAFMSDKPITRMVKLLQKLILILEIPSNIHYIIKTHEFFL